MRAYVLNLARRPERLKRFLGWNARHDLDMQVVAAVDGQTVDRAALVAEGILDAEHDQFTDGALGNALSHRGQWLDCIAEDRPRLILEDDACLRGDIARQMLLVGRALAGADLLFLGYNMDAPLALLMPTGWRPKPASSGRAPPPSGATPFAAAPPAVPIPPCTGR